jgi:hypothetical protein
VLPVNICADGFLSFFIVLPVASFQLLFSSSIIVFFVHYWVNGKALWRHKAARQLFQ